MFDVAIIGAGVSGSALAYELSRFHLDVVVLEKENDVSLGASRANTAIVHGGYDPPPDTLMGHLNVDGARMCMELVDRLDVEFRKTGSLIVAFDEEDMKEVNNLYNRGLQNGVPSMEILDGKEVSRREPNLSKEIIGALWVPESGVINPWEFTLAMMEVAVREGVELKLCEKVTGLRKQ
ncbi:MAG: FAD-dependent oxidoreductase, partial [Clostridiaceae bacterium]|nr:FAD-dependent oxidoreductase [Clostridiaceae bacterium]